MISSPLLGRSTRRSGTVLVKVMLCLSVIVTIMALNLDGGRMMEERRRVQCIADAAALAGAGQLYSQYWDCYGVDGSGGARQAALDVAMANGYPASDVVVNIPPKSGPYKGKDGHIEVLITTKLPATFGRIISNADVTVASRSVSRGLPLDIGIIALRSSGADAFLNTSAAMVVLNKPIIVNSSDPQAMRLTGLASLVASNVEVAGGIVNSGISIFPMRARTGVKPPTLDPLAFLPIPDSSSTVRSNAPMVINSLLPTFLNPGIYRGGIRVQGASIVVMTPGTYVMEGGGFRVENLATVTGLFTTVYNGTSPTYASGPISVSGLGKVVMTAPLAGSYQGINFFQQRNLTQPISITGLGLTTITGVIYAASAHATINGSASVGLDLLGGAYVVESIRIGGIGSVTVNLNLNPPRVPDVRTVE